MNTLRPFALSALLALLAACSSAPAPVTLPPGERLGEEIQPQPSVHFAVVDATPSKFFEKTVLVEATIKAVCQKGQCWMQIEDEGKTAMVRWETGCGGKYKFPKDGAGKRVLIQGSFYPKEISPDDAEHLEEEAGQKLGLKLDGYEFNASAVLVLADQH
jgi:hypothetical protein